METQKYIFPLALETLIATPLSSHRFYVPQTNNLLKNVCSIKFIQNKQTIWRKFWRWNC